MLTRSLKYGFFGTLGGLLAVALGLAFSNLGGVIACILAALFVSLGLDPVVVWLEKKNIPRALGVAIVAIGLFGVLGILLWMVIPILSDQAVLLVKQAPIYFSEVSNEAWFMAIDERTDGALGSLQLWVVDFVSHPDTWLSVGGGVLQAGLGVVNAGFLALFVVILTMFFLSSIPVMKNGLYSLISVEKRPGFVDLSEQITSSIGRYLTGMAVMGTLNALFTLIVLSILGVRFAGVLAALALVITMIPLVGSVVSTGIIVIVCLFVSPSTAIIAGICLFVYMQVEAYVICPRIMGKAMNIPGSLVLIGATAGGTLLGLLGALVAIPVIASILLIIKKVVVPRQAMPKALREAL